jgi:hypothetical protein
MKIKSNGNGNGNGSGSGSASGTGFPAEAGSTGARGLLVGPALAGKRPAQAPMFC